MIRIALVLAAFAAVLPACSRGPSVEVGSGFVVVADIPPEPIEDLDILFVIDNSGSMQPHQTALVEAARDSLFAQLEAQMGGLPNLHIAVVTSDLGAGPYGISGCQNDGDDGRFRTPPAATCAALADDYVIDVATDQATRQTNYTGTLADAFGCIAGVGIDGCGFEQHLEAMRRALDGTHPNQGPFLRDDAVLLVVFVADEDDCSAFDTRLFDTAQDQLDSELGPMSSFRCFEFGVECDGDDARTPGAKTGCVPRDNSPFAFEVQDYVQFLNGLKADPSLVMVAGIVGGAGPVEVILEDGRLGLASVCPEQGITCPNPPPSPVDASVPSADAGQGDAGTPPTQCVPTGEVWPAPRLAAFAEAFPARYQLESICDATQLAAPLRRIAHTTGTVMSAKPCLLGPPVRAESCRVFDVTAPRTSAEQRTQLRACNGDGDVGCYVIAGDPQCSGTESGLGVDVRRVGLAPPNTHVVVECLQGATVD